jgi:hypothetical protein
MKKIIFALSVLAIISCKEESQNAVEEKQEVNKEMAVSQEQEFKSFGENLDKENAISASEMKEKFQNMKVGDTLNVKFTSEVEKVCKKKGCWMTLKLDDSLTSFVKFEDYGFFVPLNAEDRKTVVEGKAFVSETPMEELRHYAQDAGKTEEEIAAITAPEKEYGFMATGVLMEETKEQ